MPKPALVDVGAFMHTIQLHRLLVPKSHTRDAALPTRSLGITQEAVEVSNSSRMSCHAFINSKQYQCRNVQRLLPH